MSDKHDCYFVPLSIESVTLPGKVVGELAYQHYVISACSCGEVRRREAKDSEQSK